MGVREIIFRGKRLIDGQWVYGCLLHYKDGDMFICTEDYIPGVLNKYEVDPATVGQYTGLKDRNEKKIFEGDIVEGYDFNAEDGYGLVRWRAGAFEVFRNDVFGSFLECYLGTGFKVIGSIHDNPELLKGGGEA